MTIVQIREYFRSLEIVEIPSAVDKYHLDSRIGVQKICNTYKRKYEKSLKEEKRVQRMSDFDNVFTSNDTDTVLVGIDEAGRGPLAGPVAAAAVILPNDIIIEGIDDSKKLTENKREQLYTEIMEKAIQVKVGIVDAATIDEINILQSTFRAMKKAVLGLVGEPGVILVDGNQPIPGLSNSITQHTVVKGDAKSISIAAASIIAKVTRDKMMLEYDEKYPEYKFFSNKGYGSTAHQIAIREYGPSPIHRRTFLKNILKNKM